MIKLKSLFRRGQGSSSSSSAAAAAAAASGGGPSTSKKQQHSNNNRSKSQSTTSLNTAIDNEQQQQQQQQQQQKKSTAEAAYYAQQQQQHSALISERGVDVGVDHSQAAAPPTTAAVQSNTLPQQKKLKAAQKKGHKQPKLLPPPTPSQLVEQQPHHLAPVVTAQGQQAQPPPATVFVNNNYNRSSTEPSSHDALSARGAGDGVSSNSANKMSATAVPQIAAAVSGGNSAAAYEHHQETQQQLLEATAKMQELQVQLDHEKLLLEARIAELLPYQDEVAMLKLDVTKLQGLLDKSQMLVASLQYENESLRTRLRDVVNSPLSDAEKHQIIQDSQQRLHSSAPASIALPNVAITAASVVIDADAAATATALSTGTPSCLTPDWDKHSSSSEISVACLQDKIIQMEETHYSTNEELQATLQELADLQSQLGDAQAENERLAEEKDVLFKSLCRQTEKLNEARTQNSTLQELLLRDTKQQEVCTSEREKKLLDLIQTSQEEREVILVKQGELNAELQELRQAVEVSNQEGARSKERIAMLDSTIDAGNAERKQMEAQLTQAKEDISQGAIEISRLSTLLENARSKIDELEQDLARGDKTDLSDVLDAARKEKDALEERVAELQDQCSRQQAEIRRLRDQLSGVMEECKVAKNNAKCAVSDLEYRLEQLQLERDRLSADYQQLSDSSAELQVQCKCHQEDKTQLQNLLSETQKHLGEIERKLTDTEAELAKEVQLRQQEAEEWQQFQSDLLMTVRVANDFKTEALTEREQLVIDNKTQKEKIRMLEQQLEKLTKQQLQQNETQQSVMSTVQQEMASRRSKIANLNRQDSRLSVKTLIETIENNKQATKLDEGTNEPTPVVAENGINDTATATVATSILPIVLNVSNNCGGVQHSNTNEWRENVRLSTTTSSSNTNITTTTTCALNTKGPLREQQQPQAPSSQQQQATLPLVTSGSKSTLLGYSERKDPLNMLAKNGGSKRNALLKWCQNKTVGYRNIDITNFSSSWNDGLAFCAILHSYLPDHIPYDTLTPANKRRNFSLAFAAAESVGIATTLNINDMCQIERPDWTQVMSYVTAIYKHFET